MTQESLSHFGCGAVVQGGYNTVIRFVVGLWVMWTLFNNTNILDLSGLK